MEKKTFPLIKDLGCLNLTSEENYLLTGLIVI